MIFTLSVASGSPTASGAVIWTRANQWQADTTMLTEVALDAGMSNLVWQEQVPSANFSAARDFTYKRDLHGLLNPSTWYYYRFTYMGEQSPVGRFRTLPGPTYSPQMARFAVVTCNNYQQGYWQSFAKIAQQDIDFVLHLGDQIYEGIDPLNLPGRDMMLPDGVSEAGITYPASLEDYRYIYRVYRADLDMQAAREACAWVEVRDDHEYTNDNYLSPYNAHIGPSHPWRNDQQAMRDLWSWSLQAWYEYTPTRQGPQYKSIVWGDLFELMLLDQCSECAPFPCGPTFRDRTYTAGCEQMYSPDQTMHGPQQMQWLMSRLAWTTARWPIIGSPTMVFDLLVQAQEGLRRLKLRGRSGYQWEWWQILNALPPNAIFYSGDLHAFLAADLVNEQGVVVARERMTPALSSNFLGAEILTAIGLPKDTHEAQLKAVNPLLSRFNGYTNGHLIVSVGRNQIQTELWECNPKLVDSEPVLTWTDIVARGR